MKISDCFNDLPISFSSDDLYIIEFEKEIDNYIKKLNECMYDDSYEWLFKNFTKKEKKNLLDNIGYIKKSIINSYEMYFKGNYILASSTIKGIINSYGSELISPLNKCYAFNGAKYFNRSKPILEKLFLFKTNKKIKDYESNKTIAPNFEYMVHIPLNKRSLVVLKDIVFQEFHVYICLKTVIYVH